MNELKYKILLEDYLSKKYDVDKFIDKFMFEWKSDRDANVIHDDKFQRIIDRIFTGCDSYAKNPKDEFEISEKELKDEVGLLKYLWFG